MNTIMFLFSGTTVLLRLKPFHCPYVFIQFARRDTRSMMIEMRALGGLMRSMQVERKIRCDIYEYRNCN